WLHAGTDLYYRPIYLSQKLRYADAILTCCEFNRAYIAEHYGDVAPGITERVHVCYHGLDLSSFPYRPEGRPPHRIIAVGRLAKDKGFGYLLQAARALVGLLGDAALRQTLARLARRRTEEKFDMWRNGAQLAEHLQTIRRLPPAARSEAAAPQPLPGGRRGRAPPRRAADTPAVRRAP